MKSLVAAAMLSLSVIGSAHAALILNDDDTFTDTATGYKWAALQRFSGASYTAAVSWLPAGFHVASPDELATLTSAAPAVPGDFERDYLAMGGVGGQIIWGYFGDGKQWAWRSSSDTTWNTNSANDHGWTNFNYAVTPNRENADLTLFAVDTSTSVPEPSPLALMALALGGLLYLRRKRA